MGFMDYVKVGYIYAIIFATVVAVVDLITGLLGVFSEGFLLFFIANVDSVESDASQDLLQYVASRRNAISTFGIVALVATYYKTEHPLLNGYALLFWFFIMCTIREFFDIFASDFYIVTIIWLGLDLIAVFVMWLKIQGK